MRLTRIAVLLALVAGACAAFSAGAKAQQADTSPSPAVTGPALPSPKPTAEDPKVHKLAVQQFLAWQSGTINRDLYSDQVNSDLTDDVLDRGTKTLANLGGLQQALFQGVSVSKGLSFYVYRMVCQRGTIQMDFSLQADGKIALIFFE